MKRIVDYLNNKNLFNLIYSFFLIPMFLVIIMFMAYGLLNGIIFSVISIKLMIFSFIVIDLVNIILLFFTKNTKISILIISLIIFFFLIINQIKISYMNDPIFVSDFNFFQNYKNISTFTGSSLIKILKSIFLKSLPLILSFCFLCFISYKFNVQVERRKIWKISFILFFILVMVFYPYSYSKEWYFEYLYKDITRNDYSKYHSYKILYGYYGIIGGLHYQYLNSLMKYEEPNNYDERELEKLESNSLEVKDKKGTPNIVIILSESFFDIEKLNEDIIFDKAVTKNYNDLKKQGNLVNMISPSFGSMTSNVSYELLTGGNMSYFDSGFVPFLDLYKDNKERPSLVKDFKDNGYQTSIILGGDSYNSSDIMKKIGFSNYTLVEKEGHTKGYYVSDEYMGDLIINSLKKRTNKNFVMVETMESHMRYDKNKFDNYDIEVSKSTLTKEYQDVLKSYSQGIYDADKMLKKVYDYINSIDDNTIIIFFGDHLPILQDDDFNDLYRELKFFNTSNDLTNIYRNYNTEALILSNFDMNFEFPKYLGYDLLLTFLANHLDIELSSYYRWLYSTIDKLPAYNRFVFIDSKGNINYTSMLSNKEKKIYELRNKMIYKYFIKKH